jgi:hypothetical protein
MNIYKYLDWLDIFDYDLERQYPDLSSMSYKSYRKAKSKSPTHKSKSKDWNLFQGIIRMKKELIRNGF